MVLDSLGDSLKRTMKKIANAVHVDADLVKEVVRDIQRALLQADVNVKLVVQLSKTIEKRALEEKPPAGMSNREHVIRIVYDELVKILGETRELPMKKQVIMMVGLYGQGKCVHGDSVITLGSGDIVTAEAFYDNHKDLGETSLEDGTIIDVSQEHITVPSYNPQTLKIEQKKITHLWKLAGKQLLKVALDAGNDYNVKVTPEHPFFILRNGNHLQVRADQLQKDDYIAVPRSYHTKPSLYDFFKNLSLLDLDVFLPSEQVRTLIESQPCTILELQKQLPHYRNYCKLTQHLKNGQLPLSLLSKENLDQENLQLKMNKSRKRIQFPRYLTPKLAEFLGYLIGDGHLTERYLEITTSDQEILKRVETLGKELFNITPYIKKDRRSKAIKITFASVTLAHIFKNIFHFPIGKKGPALSIPHCLLIAPDESIASFLQAYIDCDGSIGRDYRVIEVSSESKILLQQINLLLRRFAIFSTLSSKQIHNKIYWRLCIKARDTETYHKEIGSRINRKRQRLEAFTYIGIRQGCGKNDMIPMGTVLKDLRCSLGCSIGEIQENAVKSYGIYERQERISREGLLKVCNYYLLQPGEFLNILTTINKGDEFNNTLSQGRLNAVLYHFTQQHLIQKTNDEFSLTHEGNQYLLQQQHYDSKHTLELISNLAYSDVNWIQVKDIQKEPCPDFVYDLTVEDNHSFIANGIIVHNTTSCGKLAKYFKKKGLRPALIAGDVHRPAAYEQLHQIADQVEVPFFGDKKEKDAVTVVQKGMDKFKRSADIIIVDTSGRHKLEDDLIDEMKHIFKATKPQEKLLVMDAAMGQQSGPQAKAFNEAIGITGIILTKLDGTAKGGGALSAAAEVGAPIVFVGTGEHPSDFEHFEPDRFISRLLGMGDIKSLLEKAQESMKGKDAEKAAKRLMSGKFNLNDMYDQMDMISGMGPLSKVAEMLPFGQNAKLKDVDMEDTQHRLQRFRVIMDSMTNEERENPDLIKASRVRRIARGAGVENKHVKEVLKYYNMTKRMMKGFSSDRKMRKNLMRQLQFGK